MKSFRSLLYLSLAFGVASCMSAGVKVEERQLAGFQKGQTTYAQVVAQLGSPTSNTLLPDGHRMIMYTYTQAQARPESFIPLVGPFVGGADARSNMVMLTFDQSGILLSYSSTASQYGVGNGMESGNKAEDRVPDQPRTTP
jgi:hypothetical protein